MVKAGELGRGFLRREVVEVGEIRNHHFRGRGLGRIVRLLRRLVLANLRWQ